MNEHAGPASALSVLIVGVFAVLLHDRHPSPTPSPIPAKPTIASKVSPTESIEPPKRHQAVPEVTKPVGPPLEERSPAPQKPPNPSVARAEKTLPSVVETSRDRPSPAPVVPAPERPPAPRPLPTTPKAPFTIVKAGEKLADVATRVYGTSDAAESLWMVNRDQVALIDSPLASGTILRTP
jgi:hypothetical protein